MDGSEVVVKVSAVLVDGSSVTEDELNVLADKADV